MSLKSLAIAGAATAFMAGMAYVATLKGNRYRQVALAATTCCGTIASLYFLLPTPKDMDTPGVSSYGSEWANYEQENDNSSINTSTTEITNKTNEKSTHSNNGTSANTDVNGEGMRGSNEDNAKDKGGSHPSDKVDEVENEGGSDDDDEVCVCVCVCVCECVRACVCV